MPQRRLIPSNNVLSSLPHAESKRLSAHLELVELAAGEVLSEHGKEVRYVYFPITALLTSLAVVGEGAEFAVSMAGREGICNVTCALGSYCSPFRTVVQCPGQALRMKAKVFVKEFKESAAFRDQVLSFVFALNLQIAQTAACTRHHEIDQRLARWLLMTRDSLSSDCFNMTHEELSLYLGVRRVGVTKSAKILKERRLISYSRGAIEIVDGGGLQAVSCSCYDSQQGNSANKPT
jgi:CRP-like cAMP-binding protein